MKFLDSSKRVGIGLGALLAMASSAVSALPVPWQLNMTKGVTKTSQDVYQIHMWAFYVCCVIGVIVFAGLTAWDTQKIKEMYSPYDDGTVAGRKAVVAPAF